MNLSEDAEAFAAIVSRLEDPEDRQRRRTILIVAVLGVVGLAMAVASLVLAAPLWAVVLGLLAMAAADLMGFVVLSRSLARTSIPRSR